jgi:glycosyltransferase involved in cell wall biosynthesis
MIAVHVTHEAVEKMGGIGAVIDGLVTSRCYRDAFERTILIGPLLMTDRPAAERLGRGGKVIYSSLDNIDTGGWAGRFRPIERSYDVGIIYGLRRFPVPDTDLEVEVEVLLVDVFRYNRDRLNLFKADLYNRFFIPSDRFENIWEFEQYVRLSEPACEAMHAIGCLGSAGDPVVVVAHEYMGVPTALKAMLNGRSAVRTIFYAHEVASARRIVEKHDGHDLMFYNLLEAGQREAKSLEDFFPEITRYFKHPLVKAARYCDAVFAVGELVGREMRFLAPGNRALPVEVVYNGVPADRQTLPERQDHRARMKQYASNLFGFEPDYIFTHVARPVLSKGIWRDLRVMHELAGFLQRQAKSAVYFMLGTLAGQRRTKDVLQMERVYGWPVHHSLGYPDLCNGEETVGEMFEVFNRHHDTVRAVLVNQFGWQRRLCGLRMPEGTGIADIRRGTDVEFGLSVYEPFGISQLEPLAFGAICVVSSVCGCLGLARHCAGGELPANILVGDMVQARGPTTSAKAARLARADREAVEAAEGKRLAEELARRLPRDEADVARLQDSGWQLGQRLGWEHVVEEYFLPAVRRAREEDQLTGPE